jgi:hypothetical protein
MFQSDLKNGRFALLQLAASAFVVNGDYGALFILVLSSHEANRPRANPCRKYHRKILVSDTAIGFACAVRIAIGFLCIRAKLGCGA